MTWPNKSGQSLKQLGFLFTQPFRKVDAFPPGSQEDALKEVH